MFSVSCKLRVCVRNDVLNLLLTPQVYRCDFTLDQFWIPDFFGPKSGNPRQSCIVDSTPSITDSS